MTKAEVLEVLDDCIEACEGYAGAMPDNPRLIALEKARAAVSEVYEEFEQAKQYNEVLTKRCVEDADEIGKLRAEVERLRRAVDRKNAALKGVIDGLISGMTKTVPLLRDAIAYTGEQP